MFFDRYESDALLRQYIRAQYGPMQPTPYLASERFYRTILDEARPYLGDATALDVGCALGRLVFEYEKAGAKKSVGIDTSQRFIQFCNDRKAKESRAEFIRGDVVRAPLQENSFDFISCINVVDRVKNPQKLVDKLYALLSSGGILLLVDPYDWERSNTPKKFRVSDMKELLQEGKWELLKEQKSIEYVTPISDTEERTYSCHLLIVKSLARRTFYGRGKKVPPLWGGT
jgi:SAM-dependent methyltransferase